MDEFYKKQGEYIVDNVKRKMNKGIDFYVLRYKFFVTTMNRTFKNIAFLFFIGFGAFYLGADFLLNQGNSDSETLRLIYQTFDMPFFFSAGMYALAAIHEQIKKRFDLIGLNMIFWVLGIVWTMILLYLNLGYESFL